MGEPGPHPPPAAIVVAMHLQFDHLYRETHHWSDSVAWWNNLNHRGTRMVTVADPDGRVYGIEPGREA